jgi:hypothetical protein
VSARIHHHNAETVPQQKLSRTENTGAIVRNSVEENYPIKRLVERRESSSRVTRRCRGFLLRNLLSLLSSAPAFPRLAVSVLDSVVRVKDAGANGVTREACKNRK